MKQGKESSRSMYTFIPWPNSTLIILFSEMLKFSKIIFPNQYIYIVKENSGYLRIFHFLKQMFQN
jgi:hypothetical protein